METRSNYVMVGAVTVALLAGVLLFIVWLAGLSNKQTKCYDIYFAQAVGGLNKGSTITFSGVPVGQVDQISLLPNRPEFVWVRIEVDDQTPVLQGTTAQIKGVGFTGVSEIQLDGAAKGAPPITQAGTAGLPGDPVGDRRPRRPAQQRSGADRPHPAPDRAPDRAAQRQEPECDRRHPREYRDAPPTCSPSALPIWRTPSPTRGLRSRNAGVAAQRVSVLADNTNRLVDRAGRPGRAGSAQGDRLDPAGDRQSRCDDHRRPPGRSEFHQVDACPKPTAWSATCASCRNRSRACRERVEQGGIGGTLGPEKLPDYKPRKK